MKLLRRTVLVLIILLLLSVPVFSLAESDYEAGIGWEFRDGVLTITANGGMEDFFRDDVGQNGKEKYQHDGYHVKSVVIGKYVTKFVMFAFGEDFYPTSMRVEEGNTIFTVIDGWLINLQTKTLICATDLSRFMWIPVARKIPAMVEKIGADAFYPYNHLIQVFLPDGVTEIGQDAISCEGLESIRLPSHLKKIDRGAFHYCISLQNVIMGSEIESIGEYAFSSCYNLERINLEDTRITVLEQNVFAYTGFKSIALPDTLQSIEADAFHSCWNLYKVIICSDDIVIHNSAFAECEGIRKIIFTKGIPKYFGDDLFEAEGVSPDRKHFLTKDPEPYGKIIPYPTLYYTAAYASKWAPNGEIEWNGYPIRQLTAKEESALQSELNQPSNAPTAAEIDIDYEAGSGWVFDGGRLLVTANHGLDDFTDNELDENLNYRHNHFPSEVETIVIGKDVSSFSPIESYGFWNYTPSEIQIEPGNPYFVRENGFIVQMQTGRLVCPANNPDFSKTIVLNNIPDGTRIIGESAFDQHYLPYWHDEDMWPKIERIVFPESLMVIEQGAFYSCEEIKSLDLPASLVSIGNDAFFECRALQRVHFGPLRALGADAFYNCEKLAAVNLEDTRITTLRLGTFAGCRLLPSMVLPETLRTIEPGAFYECESLRTLIVQSDHITVQDNAFDDCVGLKYIFFTKGVPAAFGKSLMGESETTSDGRYYISDYFMTEYQPIPYPTLFYTAEFADEWAPNGETKWHGYPIQQISQDVLDAALAQARGEPMPKFPAASVPAPADDASSQQANEEIAFMERVVLSLSLAVLVTVAALLLNKQEVRKRRKS